MKHTKKILALALSAAVVASIAAAGTLAYLTSTTEEVVNTFSVGDIQIDLWEHKNDGSGEVVKSNEYTHVLPGAELEKDPTITIEANSEECWLYTIVADNMNSIVAGAAEYTVDPNAWTVIDEDDGYTIYRFHAPIPASEEDQYANVFDGVKINPELEADDLALLDGHGIIINAFAHQTANVDQSVADDAAIQTLLESVFANEPFAPVAD